MSSLQYGQGIDDLYSHQMHDSGFWGLVDSIWIFVQRVSAILAIVIFIVFIIQVIRGNTCVIGPHSRKPRFERPAPQPVVSSEAFRRRRF